MAEKTISGRELRHGAPEETLSPGESIRIEKRDGKVFELRRVDKGKRNILTELDQIVEEIPRTGPKCVTNMANIILEGRE